MNPTLIHYRLVPHRCYHQMSTDTDSSYCAFSNDIENYIDNCASGSRVVRCYYKISQQPHTWIAQERVHRRRHSRAKLEDLLLLEVRRVRYG